MNPTDTLTLAKFLSQPEGDVTYELIDGQAVPKVSPKYFHSALQTALIILLRNWCKGKGRVGSEWAIVLQRHDKAARFPRRNVPCQGKDWVPVPDIAYISYKRLPASWKRNEACPVPPEIIIEIISPNQSVKELEEKAKDYLNAGVANVWIVEPETQSITVISPDDVRQKYIGDSPIVDSTLPSLVLTPQQIFAEADLV
ncbi:Uma2 family endonuclease [Gloeocapsopsis crepidinum LEGE 06123]|uniref:Uma2 family endonuclease n=1 Tax=Gloeocapsopsis crepidinum LEGE 06123 TaxID=588587 RepID=A0ABR9UTW4_9CHRO|nr:Uma2 family endonuclease [Gloeocapsopsis crepidinum]MBE9191717.1 Uma2 family endonuclease [Gloeocapsopsis crepidinum LEGE 06123]